jgi:hypothetical protein
MFDFLFVKKSTTSDKWLVTFDGQQKRLLACNGGDGQAYRGFQ